MKIWNWIWINMNDDMDDYLQKSIDSVKYYITDDELKNLLGSDNCILKETGWYTPYPGVDYNNNPLKQQMGYVFLGNMYKNNKNYWLWEGLSGCIGNRCTFCGDSFENFEFGNIELDFPDFGIKIEEWINFNRFKKLKETL